MKIEKCVNSLMVVILALIPVLVQAEIIPVETQSNALVLEVSNQQDVTVVYLGKKLSDPSEYTQIARQYRQAGDYTGPGW